MRMKRAGKPTIDMKFSDVTSDSWTSFRVVGHGENVNLGLSLFIVLYAIGCYKTLATPLV